jgi:hypothetical protein
VIKPIANVKNAADAARLPRLRSLDVLDGLAYAGRVGKSLSTLSVEECCILKVFWMGLSSHMPVRLPLLDSELKLEPRSPQVEVVA